MVPNNGPGPDPQYAYPYRERIIPSWAAGLLAVALPAAVILVLQALRVIRSFWDADAALFGVATAVLAASAFQVVLKWAVGGLRPHFYDRCRPDVSLASSGTGTGTGTGGGGGGGGGTGYQGIMYTTAICTRGHWGLAAGDSSSSSDSDLRDAVASFPSGHAASVFAGMLFLALYLNAKFKVFGPRAVPAAAWGLGLLVLLPLLAACLVCASLVVDHSHHGRDLVAGAAIGMRK